MTESSTRRDVVDVLTEDHLEFLTIIGQILESAEPDQRRDLADIVIAEIMRHAVAEEMYVYPAVEKHVPDGKAVVEHDKEEHEQIVRLMKDLEGVDAADGRFTALVQELRSTLEHHVTDEETEQFPQLRAHIPQDQLVDIAEKVEKAKKLAPTRPHPTAPHSEAFHKLVGPGVGFVDRLRDKLSGRATG